MAAELLPHIGLAAEFFFQPLAFRFEPPGFEKLAGFTTSFLSFAFGRLLVLACERGRAELTGMFPFVSFLRGLSHPSAATQKQRQQNHRGAESVCGFVGGGCQAPSLEGQGSAAIAAPNPNKPCAEPSGRP